ncbi:hypothetical protein COV18_00785 [Candidatus Woesearchaeota archaeon CG10_big_fil_rev_8_21_14_0_10_37_12]|nr:MAG: hypothetical protein COV18_00785 [Candidatus Woesearchaeota archaeon CG10_big_fil_rev_8_21_14_0_10_37_12]
MAVQKLSWKGLASAFAIFLGVYLAFVALFAMLNVSGLWFSPEMFGMLVSIYPGLSATGIGVLVGLIWGIVCGAICGGIFAGLYNWCSGWWN